MRARNGPHPHVELGASIVCAEARGQSETEQRLIAAVLHNRAGGDLAKLKRVALKPKQFAKPCPQALITAEHRAAFIAGWKGEGLPTWWSKDVQAFCTHKAAKRIGKRWSETYNWTRVDPKNSKLAHQFWKGKL